MTDTSTPHHAPPDRGRTALDDLFARLHALDLRRDTDRRWFGGVCSGIAARVGVDPLLIRAAAIALTVAAGLGLAIYLVLWLLLPDRYDRVLVERSLRDGETWPTVLGVVTAIFVVGGLVSFGFSGDDWGGTLWVVLPVALVVWFLATRARAGGGSVWDRPADGSGYAPPPPGAAYPPAAYPHAPGSGQAPPPPAAAGTAGAVPAGTPVPPPPGGPPMSAPTSSFAPGTAPGTVTAVAAPPAAPPGPPPVLGHPGPGAGAPIPPRPPVPVRPIGPPPPPTPRRRRPSGFVGLVSLGVVIVLGGLGTALAGPLGFPGNPGLLGLVLALAGVAAVVLGLGLSGRASGLSGFLVALVALVTIVAAAASNVPTATGGVGERAWAPAAGTLPVEYSLGAGDAVLDLRNLTSLTATGEPGVVTVDIGAGELLVKVPDGLDARVETQIGFGDVRHEQVDATGTTLVESRSGDDVDFTAVIGDDRPDVVVRAELGLGAITIQEG